jgi:hypothetical protein
MRSPAVSLLRGNPLGSLISRRFLTRYQDPIMSRALADLSDPEFINRDLMVLRLVFSPDVADSNYIRVSFDFSEDHRKTVQPCVDRKAPPRVARRGLGNSEVRFGSARRSSEMVG